MDGATWQDAADTHNRSEIKSLKKARRRLQKMRRTFKLHGQLLQRLSATITELDELLSQALLRLELGDER
jgi:hypothetical protein